VYCCIILICDGITTTQVNVGNNMNAEEREGVRIVEM